MAGGINQSKGVQTMKRRIELGFYALFIILGVIYLIKSPIPPYGGILVAFGVFRIVPLLIKRGKREVK
jgi:hypothetical protein